jgi:hypothetical protein
MRRNTVLAVLLTLVVLLGSEGVFVFIKSREHRQQFQDLRDDKDRIMREWKSKSSEFGKELANEQKGE